MSGENILIVEDSRTQAAQLAHTLEESGYRVAIATNGEEGLAAARRNPPRLIISDVLMPVMDGHAMCKALKSEDALNGVPVMLLSTLSDPRDVILGIEAGVDYYVTKPYQVDALLSKVAAVLAAPPPSEAGQAGEEFPVTLGGETLVVRSSRRRIMNVLISIYENTVRQNQELVSVQGELRALNARLAEMVDERTEALKQEVAVRRRAEEDVKAMTQHLWQAAKLATMGELAASIAHELNNPLATVHLRIESLQAHMPEGDPRRHSLEIVEKELDRMARLVADLLQFSRRSQPQISTVDVREEIEKTLDLIAFHLRKLNVTVHKDFGPDLLPVLADRQQLRQVFLNLFSNAADAMPHGGDLTIRVGMAGTPAHVSVEVIDTGSGIPPELISKVMEPFFTTKPEGKGTGLGLPICRRIVAEHHGTLGITSEVNRGTTVSVALPAVGA